jgi:hypothetical protein
MKYEYIGFITSFGKIICNKWQGETQAVSPKKALINLSFRFKKENGLGINSKIELDKKYLKEV